MQKSVIIILIILAVVAIRVVIGIVYLPAMSHVPEQHTSLRCLQQGLESIPHMKWNCYYFTQK
ncbi:MAG: hypothetical protein ACREBI_03325 [Nitrosotalea sp.]